jgi:hypothetical protein
VPHRTHSSDENSSLERKRAFPSCGHSLGGGDVKSDDAAAGKEVKTEMAAPCGPEVKAARQSEGGDRHSHVEEKDLSDEDLHLLSKQLARNLGGSGFEGSRTSCHDLIDTELGSFLTAKARSVSPRDVVVRVVADVLSNDSKEGSVGVAGVSGGSYAGLPCRIKAIYAFQSVDDGEFMVLCFGMYVHEYGPGCVPVHAGRVYIECVDSVPLYGQEKGEERQVLLSTIVLAYFEHARNVGLKVAHMRVPPPTDDNSHIFASRSLAVRLRASLHLSHWYKRLLQSAQAAGIIHEYWAGQADVGNFPLSMLSAAEMEAERCFLEFDHKTLDRQTAQLLERVNNLRERFFVICLQQSHAQPAPTPGKHPIPRHTCCARGTSLAVRV